MAKVIGVINLGNEREQLQELTNHRSMASVPFAGRYRLIDFTLSNMINAGVHNVAVFTRKKYRSLLDHLGSGKEWDLDRQQGGLFILPPPDYAMDLEGDIQHFKQNMAFFNRSRADYVLVSNGNLVWNIDFTHVFNFHEEMEADITVIFKEFNDEKVDTEKFDTLEENEQGWISSINRDVSPKPGDRVYLDTFFIKKELLLDMIQKCDEQGDNLTLVDAVKDKIDRFKIAGYHFKGYFPFIQSLESFYRHSMALLDPNVSQELFFNRGLIYTKVKHEPPAKYMELSDVQNSLIANGCVIEGTVENSILFRGVKVHKDAVVKNSIVMQKSEIGEGAYLENVILDKDVKVSPGKEIAGDNVPTVIAKSTVL
ncbi:glucose-1-phosphate adenylyltransferase subunit GlgD [Pseudalkalibacillus caeni]|uniref:Glucose-1-phosphate adenylyltransferase subunit GlgD n=1 Tax=Exobacillus caeni TaxID=2574798 RepID=A0A5R9F1J4_9BACL|nr:glucose-1-phosphate adenylyltransferase subunit GlgD [Pseudalkalibacillus caeni]TLS37512.1 glucose-1-phosphate adenylyltransferase subunit GlgD [Pseudalkalibacillus caeni]